MTVTFLIINCFFLSRSIHSSKEINQQNNALPANISTATAAQQKYDTEKPEWQKPKSSRPHSGWH